MDKKNEKLVIDWNQVDGGGFNTKATLFFLTLNFLFCIGV